MSDALDVPGLLAALTAAARQAATVILGHYHGRTAARTKADHSPVTAAAEAAEALITPILERLLPGVPVIAEEAAALHGLPSNEGYGERRFWLLDPLDGTKEFLSGNGEFTVNIALIEHGRPLLGVVGAPTLDTVYAGGPGGATVQHGDGAPKPIAARKQPAGGAIVLGSRSHGQGSDLDAFLAAQKVLEHRVAGSSLKFCQVAEGIADLYPRFGRTMEWDTAAGHAVLAAAGGHVETLDGRELGYGKPGFENPHFVARGR
ncbi:MAG: 3'(2'),5'-bisphosphate nucleotidase CysQ [Dongiaceae bacterium]